MQNYDHVPKIAPQAKLIKLVQEGRALVLNHSYELELSGYCYFVREDDELDLRRALKLSDGSCKRPPTSGPLLAFLSM